MQTMKSDTGSRASTRSSAVGSLSSTVQIIRSETVIELLFDALAEIPPPGGTDIDNYLSTYSDDQAAMQTLQEGNRWVAETFYAGEKSLKALRLIAGLSQAELAARLGTQQSYISRLEQGNTEIRIGYARRLAVALSVSLDDIADACDR